MQSRLYVHCSREMPEHEPSYLCPYRMSDSFLQMDCADAPAKSTERSAAFIMSSRYSRTVPFHRAART